MAATWAAWSPRRSGRSALQSRYRKATAWCASRGPTRTPLSQPLFIQTVTKESAGGGGNACGGGYQSQGFFIWPTGARYLSGYDFGQNGHNGIDIFATEGTPVFAADNGVVTMAQGGWNYGYGNVVQIDHGNGFVTIYAHLSVIEVSMCQAVGAGQVIGAAGNTGNSFGAHLHFEVRKGGGNINPWFVLQ